MPGDAQPSPRKRPFDVGQVIRRLRDGVLFRVTRDYVPPKPGYFDVDAFEIVRVSAPEPTRVAAWMAEFFEREEAAMPQTENVDLTLDEIKGLRMALIFGVPDPEPAEIASARGKLDAAQGRLDQALRR